MNFLIVIWLITFSIAGMAAQGHDSLQIPWQDAHQAPLKLCDIEDKRPDSYTVYLMSGVSLKEHTERVGSRLPDAIYWVFDKLYSDKLLYSAQLGAELLDSVRADVGVELVECKVIKRPSKIRYL